MMRVSSIFADLAAGHPKPGWTAPSAPRFSHCEHVGEPYSSSIAYTPGAKVRSTAGLKTNRRGFSDWASWIAVACVGATSYVTVAYCDTEPLRLLSKAATRTFCTITLPLPRMST